RCLGVSNPASFPNVCSIRLARPPDGVKGGILRPAAVLPERCAGEDLNLHGLCTHKALNLARLPIPPPARGATVIVAGLLEKLEEPDRVGDEDQSDEARQPRQIALDDVRSALRGRREAHAAEAGVTAGAHEDQP